VKRAEEEVARKNLLNAATRKRAMLAARKEIHPKNMLKRLGHSMQHDAANFATAAKGTRRLFTKPPPPTKVQKHAMRGLALTIVATTVAATSGLVAVFAGFATGFAIHATSRAIHDVMKASFDKTEELRVAMAGFSKWNAMQTLAQGLEVASEFVKAEDDEDHSDAEYVEAFVALVAKRTVEILENDELDEDELRSISEDTEDYSALLGDS
jgi:hypothetical protein